MGIGVFLVVLFGGMFVFVLVIVRLVLRMVALPLRRAGQPQGRPGAGGLDWLPENDDLHHESHHGHHHHHHTDPGPAFDSSPSPASHDAGGGHHH
jgi:hypothetical protein